MPPAVLRPIGRTGQRVFPIGLGAMPLSLAGRPAESAAIAVIHAALDEGVTLIDTADSYCRDEKDYGHNERLIAKALKSHPLGKHAKVATKGGYTRPHGGWVVDARPDRLRKCCEASLRALGVETLWLYQLHHPDGRVPFAESVGALARLKQQGKVLHLGLSNVSAEQIAQAQRIVRIETVQNECNPLATDDFRNGVIASCARQGMTYIAYSPVGGQWGHRQQSRNRLLAAIAKAHGVSAYQVALAWLLQAAPHIVPIPGASKVSSIRDSAKAVELMLTKEEIQRIDALAP